MNKKILLGIILVLTCLSIVIILVFNISTKYNKLVVGLDKWNSIINNRNMSTSIYLESIEFNDYSLVIDNDNNVIYYSIVNSSSKYNPSVKYSTNIDANIVISDTINDSKLEKSDDLKIMIYNNIEYRIYTLVVTAYPVLNIKISDDTNDKVKKLVELELFDNHVNSKQRVLKSYGKLKIIDENKEYSFSLIKESLGHNKRDNYISVFGMEKRNEYVMKKVDDTNTDDRYVQLFINNRYNGLYSFGPKEGRRIDNYEQNRINNK